MNQHYLTKILIGIIVLGLGRDSYLLLRHQDIPAAAKEASPEARIGTAAPSAGQASLPNFSALVAQNGPAVVNISVSGNAKVANPTGPQNNPFPGSSQCFQPAMPQNSMPTQVLGSGFIVRADGVIITNAHVVENASEVTVKLTDKCEFKAKLIGIDRPTDTAVLSSSNSYSMARPAAAAWG